MILNIDVTGKSFQVTKLPEPKLDNEGKQRIERATGTPLWSTQLVCFDDDGGAILKVSTHGEVPECGIGDEVEVTQLVAIPWFNKNAAGVAYTAAKIEAVYE